MRTKVAGSSPDGAGRQFEAILMVQDQGGGEEAAGPTAGGAEAAERWELRREEAGTREEEEEDGGTPEQPCPSQVHDMEAADAAKPGDRSSCPWTCCRMPGG